MKIINKNRQEKGITLIALVITIIVLLILAVVSIRLVMNNGILGKAESGVSKYQEAEADEQEQLLKAEYEMAKYEGKFSGSFTEYVVDKKYPGLKIGDYVAYNEAGTGDYKTDTSKGIGGSVGTKDSTTGKYPLVEKTYTTENLGWRVLGVNNKGELELICDNPMSDSQTVCLANEEGYLYGADELNTMCKTLYGNGTGSTGKVVATGARSLNVDDIDKLAGITTEEQKKAIDSSYGVEWICRYPTQSEMDEFRGTENSTRYMQYSKDGGTTWDSIADSQCQTFRIPGESEIIGKISDTEIKEGSRKLKNTIYTNYKVQDYVKQIASDGKSMADIITKGTGTGGLYQWLASPYVSCYSGGASFGLHFVGSGYVTHSSYSLFTSNDYSSSHDYGVRPVVSLKSDIQIDTNAKDGKTPSTAYEIK